MSQKSCTISREFEEDGYLLKIILTKNEDGVSTQFNFHKQIEKLEDAINFLKDKLISYRDKSITIASEVYNLTLEVDGE